jgi:hypothetical protein
MLTPQLDAPMLGASNVLFDPGYLDPRSIRIASADGGFPSSFAFFWPDLEYHAVGAASFVSRADSHNGGLDPERIFVIPEVGLKKVF